MRLNRVLRILLLQKAFVDTAYAALKKVERIQDSNALRLRRPGTDACFAFSRMQTSRKPDYTGMMPRVMNLGLTFAWAVVLSAMVAMAQDVPVAPVSNPPAPSIVCDEPVYKFGRVSNTTEVEHVFVIRNAGNLTLEIRNVRAACGCTATAISNKMVEPGQTAEIRAKLNLRGRQGAQHKPIYVDSNDPRTPTLALAFEGIAEPDVKIQPRQIFFGRIGQAAVVTGVVELASAAGRPLVIKRVDSGNPILTAVVVDEGTSEPRVLIKTVPTLPKGPFQSRVIIETDHPTQPVTEIFVTGFVVGDVTYAPTELVLPEQPDSPTVRYVLMRSETGQPFEVLSVHAPFPEMETVVQPTAPGAYRIEIRNIRPTSALNGQSVRVSTTLPESKEIVIPFRIISAAN